MEQLQHLDGQQIKEYESRLRQVEDQERRKRVLAWISEYDYKAKHVMLDSQQTPGTCEWIFQSIEYQSWIMNGPGLLLVQGIRQSLRYFLIRYFPTNI